MIQFFVRGAALASRSSAVANIATGAAAKLAARVVGATVRDLAEATRLEAPEELKGSVVELPIEASGRKVTGGVAVRHPKARAIEYGTEEIGPDHFFRRAVDEIIERARREGDQAP